MTAPFGKSKATEAADRELPVSRSADDEGCRDFFNLARLVTPAPEFDLKYRLRETIDPSTGSLKHGFDGYTKVIEERRKRGKSLSSFALAQDTETDPAIRDKARYIAGRLEGAVSRYDFPSFCDPVFTGEFRRRIFGEILRLVESIPVCQVKIYHIISSSWKRAGGHLEKIHSKQIRESLRANLERAGLAQLPGWIACFLHNEYDSAIDIYWPHFHIIVIGDKYKAFEELRGLKMFAGGYSKEIYRPIEVQDLVDPPRQISYLFKSYIADRASFADPHTGRKRRQRLGRRIPEPRHAEALLWMNQQHFSDLIWLHGVKIRDGRLEPSDFAT